MQQAENSFRISNGEAISPQISQSSKLVTRVDQTGVPFCGVLMHRLLDRKGNFVGIFQGAFPFSALVATCLEVENQA
jgi:hypothetical protein